MNNEERDELLSLIDGAMNTVELSGKEWPAAAAWRNDWLTRARAALMKREAERAEELSAPKRARYVRRPAKPEVFDALQWNGENAEEVLIFRGDSPTPENVKRFKEIGFSVGCWFLRHGDASCHVVTEKSLVENYEPIEPPAPEPDLWVVELEPGCWLTPMDGDPGRTVRIENAEKYSESQSLWLSLNVKVWYAPKFKNARAVRLKDVQK